MTEPKEFPNSTKANEALDKLAINEVVMIAGQAHRVVIVLPFGNKAFQIIIQYIPPSPKDQTRVDGRHATRAGKSFRKLDDGE